MSTVVSQDIRGVMIAVTGAAIVLSVLPEDRNGFSRAFASADFTKTIRPGSQLALVGPSFMRSTISASSSSGTGFACQPL